MSTVKVTFTRSDESALRPLSVVFTAPDDHVDAEVAKQVNMARINGWEHASTEILARSA